MTLVLTELSHCGIAMAADSAITYPNQKILTGYQKLMPIPLLCGGLSCWGLGNIGKVPTDRWLASLLKTAQQETDSLKSLGDIIARRLNSSLSCPAPGRLGIHIAGYEDTPDGKLPVFYHVHNGHYKVGIVEGDLAIIPLEEPPIREFRCHPDCLPRRFSSEDTPHFTYNGDFIVFAYLFEVLGGFTHWLEQQIPYMQFPFPDTLDVRGEALRFWITLVADIYRLSSRRPRFVPRPPTGGTTSIGKPISVLTLTQDGIQSFYEN